jgi:protein-disulfide isomerase
VIGITWLSWSVAQRPLTALPGHASRDAARLLTTPVGAVIALALVVGSVVAVKAFPSESRMAPATVEALPPVTDAQRAQLAEWWEMQPKVDVPVDGGGAKVVVVKFNDYQCPSCRVTHNAYKALLRQHGPAVKYMVKHYPLEAECNASAPGGGHTAACEAAAAVNMARPKGTADAVEEWLFANIGPPVLTPAQVKNAARDIGGITDFDAQYPEVLKGIREDVALGDRLKVNTTPTFFINGRMVPQILAAQYFNALIEIELKRP